MKKFGFMMLTLAVAAFSLMSCGGKTGGNDDPIVPPTPGGDEVKIPAVDPTDGAVTLLVYFDQGLCEGFEVRFVGDHAENAWDIASAPAMQAIGDGWYKYLIRPGKNEDQTLKETMAGRPIQANAELADWGYDWSHNPEDIEDLKGVKDGMKATNEYGETNLNFTSADAQDAAIVVFRAKKWNKTPCAAKATYNITVALPAFCDGEFAVELVGSFEGWGTTPVALVKGNDGKYTASITAAAGDQWKVRGEGGWDKEIVGYVSDPDSEAYDTWIGVANNELGDETNVTMDYSDAAKYKWNVCE